MNPLDPRIILAVTLLPALAPAQLELSPAEQEAGWELLFDGESTEHFRGFKKEGFPEQGWIVEDGALRHVAGSGGGDVITKKMYRDFELAFEWKVGPGANSGIMYRTTEDEGATWRTGPDYQVLDDDRHSDGRNPKHGAGALYGLLVAEGKELEPVGEWNTGRIVLIGNRLEHWLNGKRVVSTFLNDPAWDELVAKTKFRSMPNFGKRSAGHIAFQDHGDDAWYRAIKVRDLSGAGEARQLFNGKDMEGLTHHLNSGGLAEDTWSVTSEGILVCTGHPAGYIRTTEDFTNYVLKVRWRFNPITRKGGNSGVLLRVIGEDKVWPRSIEAQLRHQQAGDFWNIDKYPMSVVESRTRGRNTVRTSTNEKPIGEWNEYDITVVGGDVVLRVNGEILNQAWDCLETPGKIAFQSEGTEIHFAEISIVPLP